MTGGALWRESVLVAALLAIAAALWAWRASARPDDLEDEVGRVARGRATLLSAERLEDARVLVYSVEVHRSVRPGAVIDALAEKLAGVEVRVLTGAESSTP